MDSSQAENPCPNCGYAGFTWGILLGASFAKSEGLLDNLAHESLASRVCDNCGNVQIFLKYAVQDAIEPSKHEKRKREE